MGTARPLATTDLCKPVLLNANKTYIHLPLFKDAFQDMAAGHSRGKDVLKDAMEEAYWVL